MNFETWMRENGMTPPFSADDMRACWDAAAAAQEALDAETSGEPDAWSAVPVLFEAAGYMSGGRIVCVNTVHLGGQQ